MLQFRDETKGKEAGDLIAWRQFRAGHVVQIDGRVGAQRQDGERVWYLLADDEGRPIAGNLDRWPKLSAHVSEARFVTLPDGQRMFAQAARLGPSAQFLVGRSDMGARTLLLCQQLDHWSYPNRANWKTIGTAID